MIEPSHSGQFAARAEHPTLARTLENPVVKLVVGLLMTLVAAYLSIQVTRIDRRFDTLESDGRERDKRIIELEKYREVHTAEHRTIELERSRSQEQWERLIGEWQARQEKVLEEWRVGQSRQKR